MDKKVFNAVKDYARADVYVSEMLTDKTRSSVKKLFENRFISVNGKQAKPSQSICTGDIVEVVLPDAVEYKAKPEDIPVDIVYEDGDIAVVNKPQGMTVHLGNGNKFLHILLYTGNSYHLVQTLECRQFSKILYL